MASGGRETKNEGCRKGDRSVTMRRTCIPVGAAKHYRSKNPEQAAGIRPKDKELDRMNAAVIQEFTKKMAQPAQITELLNLLLVAGHLERVGDHAKNIAEETVYVVEAADIRHQH